MIEALIFQQPETHVDTPTLAEFYGEAETKRIDMKTWGASTAEQPLLATDGLGPCIGIAAYDPTIKTGYMAHIAVPMFEQSTIDDFLNTIKAATSDIDQLKIWVRGGQKSAAMSTPGDFDMPQMGRDSIAGQLQGFGLAEGNLNITYDDAPMASQATEMWLDAATGTFETEVTIPPHAKVLGTAALSH